MTSKEVKKDNIEKTKILSHEEFRFLFLSLAGASLSKTIEILPTLFSPYMSKEDQHIMITEDINTKLGGIEEVEKICEELDCDILYDTDEWRKRLKIAPFEYVEEERQLKRNVL